MDADVGWLVKNPFKEMNWPLKSHSRYTFDLFDARLLGSQRIVLVFLSLDIAEMQLRFVGLALLQFHILHPLLFLEALLL